MVDNYTEFPQKKKLRKQIRKETNVGKRTVSKILTIFFSFTFVIALLLGSSIIFHNVYFQSFFVNGQSMYPTLNGNATYSDGTPIGRFKTGPDNGNIVEYGIMDMHPKAIDKINRFDIIILAYNEYETNDKIKRVIALPGEEFYFLYENNNTKNTANLYVRTVGSEEFVYVAQNFGDENILRSIYNTGDNVPSINNKIKLNNDEYYVLGDNRTKSHDSIAVGPVVSSNIRGVAVAIEGNCTLVCGNTGCSAEDIRFHWPRSLKWKDV